jgi:hypothetical protein
MNFRLSIFVLSWLLALGSLFLVSCEPDKVCHQELQAAVQITLSADSVTAAGDTMVYAQWDSILVVGVGSDVGLKGKNLKGIGLELRPDTTLTQFLVQYHNQVDTLSIEHTPRLQYISAACGCAIYHTILRAWSSDPRVDSVSIINASVEALAQDNLCIYMHE